MPSPPPLRARRPLSRGVRAVWPGQAGPKRGGGGGNRNRMARDRESAALVLAIYIYIYIFAAHESAGKGAVSGKEREKVAFVDMRFRV